MEIWIWIGFIVLIFIFLALDLGVFHKSKETVNVKQALIWTGIWIVVSLLFNVVIYYMYENHWLGIGLHIGHNVDGSEAALKFFTGYVLEKSLSMDNIFVIAMIFGYFKVELRYQHDVLFWGILGALIMRGMMIGAGVYLIEHFAVVNYFFGGFLLYSAVKMLIARPETIEPNNNFLVRFIRRIYPVSGYEGGKFFTRINGKKAITPLFIVLLVVETTDLMFALDSIPAIFAVTTDPFIIFTSNIFAILGLRSLYFALAALMDKFRYLKMSLVFILAFVGVKMLLVHHFLFPTFVSLAVILGILTVGIVASLIGGHKDPAKLESPLLSREQEIAQPTDHTSI